MSDSPLIQMARNYLVAAEAERNHKFNNFLQTTRNERATRVALTSDPSALATLLLEQQAEIDRLRAALASDVVTAMQVGGFELGTPVAKKSGGMWRGRVVGYYTTSLTPLGVAVESHYEPGSVQIYPVRALVPWQPPEETAGSQS